MIALWLRYKSRTEQVGVKGFFATLPSFLTVSYTHLTLPTIYSV